MVRARDAAARLLGRGWPAVALVLVVFGSRVSLVRLSGSSLPLWDQWWADFEVLVLPMAEGRLGWQDVLFTFNNEHRLLGERLLTLAQIWLSGRWEPRDGLVLSAAVRAGGLAIAYVLLSRGQPAPARRAILLLLTAVGSLPVATFNLLSAFQVQFYVCEPLHLGALALLCGCALSAEGVAGAGALLLLALLTMATAPIAALAAALVLALRSALVPSGDTRRALAVVSYLVAFGIFAFVSTPHSSTYFARNGAEFFHVLMRLLAWPFPDRPVLGVLTLVPPALLAHRLVRERTPPGPAWFVLAVSTYALVQAAAIAFSRGAVHSDYPQHADGLWLGQVAGFAALVAALPPSRPTVSRWRSRVCVFWGLWLGVGLVSDAALRGAPMLQSVRVAVGLREPRFGEALRTGQLSDFERESRLTTDGVRRGEYGFFSHPAGRFVVPDVAFADLTRRREQLLAWLPASLAGAPPSRVTRALSRLTELGPALVAAGLAVGLAGWWRERRAVRAPRSPASADRPGS
jgi:hypothetical protein